VTGIRIAVLDSGIEGSVKENVVMSSGFLREPDGGVTETVTTDDQLGHGTALVNVILSEVPTVQLLIAQLFTQKLVCTPLQVASGLDWAVLQGAQLVNMSFGLSHDRPVLREACARALAAGVLLVAASPARGAPVFPAAYPGVIGATGDARCQAGEISFLDSPQADFGGCVHSSVAEVSGASAGCAYVTAKIARYLSSGLAADRDELNQWLIEQACYHGRERRTH
jgi:hypothetical protein